MVAALKEGDEAFLCGGKPGLTEEEEEEPLREALIMKALELARGNSALHTLGMDGTACPLHADAAAALGGFPVKALKLVGLEFARPAGGGDDARSAFVQAVAANPTLVTLAIFQTNADGDWATFEPATSAFAADIQDHRAAAAKEQPSLAPIALLQVAAEGRAASSTNGGTAKETDDGEEGEAEGEEDDEDDEDDEDEDYVECDGRLGPSRKAPACGKRLRGDDAVFHSALGRDYCADCHARLGRGERQATAAERIREEPRGSVAHHAKALPAAYRPLGRLRALAALAASAAPAAPGSLLL